MQAETTTSNTQIDKNDPYAFALPIDQAAAFLKLGWKSHRVAVTSFSWRGYSVVAPRNLRRLSIGARASLKHQGLDYAVAVSHREKLPNGFVSLELSRCEPVNHELINAAKGKGNRNKQVSANGSDPFLQIAILIGVMFLLMALPGVGSSWGTSSYITDLAYTVGRTVFHDVLGLR